MSLETLFSNPLPAIPPSRSLLSRFASPLAKRNRNITEFCVEPDHPWKSYGPGDIVRGHIVLTAAKGFDITHLVVCLHGFAKVYKNQVYPSDGPLFNENLDLRGGSQDVEYRGNGLVSLFQDEAVLCRDGFLKKGIYKFGFELVFPTKNLPSSIDFERGTISYFISATLTRPTGIAPTTSCFQRLTFHDSIDIGHLPSPKPRVISLEPISKRGRVKVKLRPSSLEKKRDGGSRIHISRNSTGSSIGAQRATSSAPQPLSPASSETTADSQHSGSTHSFQLIDNGTSPDTAGTNDGDARSSIASTPNLTITATAELLRQGGLPGDELPIRLTVAHNKPNVRGLVIVTLFRQSRIDMHPTTSIPSRVKNQEAGNEDVYLCSKTGLGGLSFSNNSPSRSYRKDLSQSTAMMIVNPQTMTADVKTSVKLPENAVPTMSNVPGGMISFKYYVEVVADICGKLGEPRYLPRLTSTKPGFTDSVENSSQQSSDWANCILDTVQLRRTKSVVDFTFSIIVGTADSSRGHTHSSDATFNASVDHSLEDGQANISEGWLYVGENGYEYPYWEGDDDEQNDLEHGSRYENAPTVPHFLPPPQPEEQADEKTRLRRQEALLLPSQPPDACPSSIPPREISPSAPILSEVNDHYPSPDDFCPAIESSTSSTFSPASSRSAETITPVPGLSQSPPTFEGNGYNQHSEDKQELERRWLLAQASAPPHVDDQAATPTPLPAPMIPVFEPSAPKRTEVDEYDAHTINHARATSENLPQY